MSWALSLSPASQLARSLNSDQMEAAFLFFKNEISNNGCSLAAQARRRAGGQLERPAGSSLFCWPIFSISLPKPITHFESRAHERSQSTFAFKVHWCHRLLAQASALPNNLPPLSSRLGRHCLTSSGTTAAAAVADPLGGGGGWRLCATRLAIG